MCKDTSCFVDFTNDGISNGTLLLVFNWVAVVQKGRD